MERRGRKPRVTQKVLTAEERNEQIIQLEREQILLLESLITAQGEVERIKLLYYKNKEDIDKLNKAKVFENEFAQAQIKKVI